MSKAVPKSCNIKSKDRLISISATSRAHRVKNQPRHIQNWIFDEQSQKPAITNQSDVAINIVNAMCKHNQGQYLFKTNQSKRKQVSPSLNNTERITGLSSKWEQAGLLISQGEDA